jgi:hypothetical protein
MSSILVFIFWAVLSLVLMGNIACVSGSLLCITGSTELGGGLAQIITTPIGIILMTLGWLIETCIGTICAPIGRLYNLIFGGMF